MGRKKKPFYRIVVMDSRARRDGRYLEKVGHYNPVSNPAEVNIDKEKVLKWLEKGAEPTKTVFNLLQKEGIALDWHLIRIKASEQVRNVEMQKFELAKKVREDKKAAAEVVAEEPAEAPVAEETAETVPAEEAKPEETQATETAVEEPVAEDKADAVKETAEAKEEEKTETTAPEAEEKPEEEKKEAE